MTLRQNFFWTLTGRVAYAVSQWGILILMAKLGSPEMLGQFSLGLAITAPIVLFLNFQLRQVQATDVTTEYEFANYLLIRLLTSSLALIIIYALCVFCYSGVTAIVIFIIGLAKVIESISDIFYGLFQKVERLDFMAKSYLAKGSLSSLLLGVGIWLTKATLGGATCLLLAWIIVLTIYDIPRGKALLGKKTLDSLSFHRKNFHKNKKQLRNLLGIGWPLGVSAMLVSLVPNIPIYFIDNYYGNTTLGFYAALFYLFVAGTTVVGALGQSATPRLAKYYSVGNRAAFQLLILKLIGFGALLGLCGIVLAFLFGDLALSFLYSDEYARYQKELCFIMVAAFLNYISSFLLYGIMSAKMFKIQMPLSFLILIAITILCAWWE